MLVKRFSKQTLRICFENIFLKNFPASIPKKKYCFFAMSSDKINGMFLGVVYGDAMGAPCEFNVRRARSFDGVITSDWYFDKRSQYGYKTRHEVGQVTDDTEMTIACLQAVVTGYTKEGAIRQYHKFVNSGTHSLGHNTRALFHGYKTPSLFWKRFDAKFVTGDAIEGAQSNGHLMRVAPFALIEDPNIRRDASRLDTSLSNPSTVARRVTDVLVDLLYKCRKEEDPKRAQKMVMQRTTEELQLCDVGNCFSDALDPRFPRDLEWQRGWNLHSLSVALWVGIHAPSMHDGIVEVIRKGGDTDTNASIAGALLGAIFGEKHCMADARVASNYKIIRECVPRIHHGKVDAITCQDRPPIYHPQNIAELVRLANNAPHDAEAIATSLRAVDEVVSSKRQRTSKGIVVGIFGASCAGKSTLAKRVSKYIAKNHRDLLCEVIAQDAFRILRDVPEVDGKKTWEHESLTDWNKLVDKISAAKRSNDVVIVEGYMLVTSEDVCHIVDHWVHIESSNAQCRERRRTYPSIEKYGLRGWKDCITYVDSCVWPNHTKILTNGLPKSDLRLETNGSIDDRTSSLVDMISTLCNA
jgi:ADP-ribosylglycohydrolase/uridine kinase